MSGGIIYGTGLWFPSRLMLKGTDHIQNFRSYAGTRPGQISRFYLQSQIEKMIASYSKINNFIILIKHNIKGVRPRAHTSARHDNIHVEPKELNPTFMSVKKF
jgi:hypothetical protein